MEKISAKVEKFDRKIEAQNIENKPIPRMVLQQDWVQKTSLEGYGVKIIYDNSLLACIESFTNSNNMSEQYICKEIGKFFEFGKIYDVSFVMRFLEDLKSKGAQFEIPLVTVFKYNLDQLKKQRKQLGQQFPFLVKEGKSESIEKALIENKEKIAFLEQRIQYVMSLDSTYKRDLDAVLRTLFGESRGEPKDIPYMMKIIACRTMLARSYKAKYKTDHPHFGLSLHETCKKPFQFSTWSTGNIPNAKMTHAVDLFDFLDADSEKSRENKADSVMFKLCWQNFQTYVWQPNVFLSKAPALTHYHMKHMKQLPDWAVGKKPSIITDVHIYYDNIDTINKSFYEIRDDKAIIWKK